MNYINFEVLQCLNVKLPVACLNVKLRIPSGEPSKPDLIKWDGNLQILRKLVQSSLKHKTNIEFAISDPENPEIEYNNA